MGNCFNPGPIGSPTAQKPTVEDSNNTQTENQDVSPDHIELRALPGLPDREITADDRIVRAMFDFAGVGDEDVTFAKGDLLRVNQKTEADGWWLATHLKTGQHGYIPSNYVCKNDNSLEAQDWFLDVEAKEARGESEILLMLPGNCAGTFLVRRCNDERIPAVLSVRYDKETGEPAVAHYRMRRMDDGGVYFNTKRTFHNIFDLIAHYSRHADGLATRLSVPCPRIQPVPWDMQMLEIDREAITKTTQLGEGHFGEVWKAKLQRKVDVAVKTLKPDKMTLAQFMEEAKVMHELRHKKLVRLLAVCTKDEPYYIVTEFMVNGALLDFLRNDEGTLVKFSVMIKMAAQIADGMAYLEAKNYIHRDLRAANILVGKYYDVKVADFGLAKFLDEDCYNRDLDTKFPVKWTAPEAITHQKFSIKSDIWSFGVLLYEIVTYGKHPYPGMSNREVMQCVPTGYQMSPPSGCPRTYYEIMKQCWTFRASSRPTFEYLHSCFDDFEVSTQRSYEDADRVT